MTRPRINQHHDCKPTAALADLEASYHASAMFAVSEEDAAAIRAAFEQGGEFSAAIEVRRRFPLIDDNAQAREHARTIAGWKPIRAIQLGRKPSAT